jgi:hypothetical protein
LATICLSSCVHWIETKNFKSILLSSTSNIIRFYWHFCKLLWQRNTLFPKCIKVYRVTFWKVNQIVLKALWKLGFVFGKYFPCESFCNHL